MSIRLITMLLSMILIVAVLAIYRFRPDLLENFTVSLKDPINQYTGFGLALGIALGSVFEDVGVGVALGIAVGAGLGSYMKKKQDKGSLNK